MNISRQTLIKEGLLYKAARCSNLAYLESWKDINPSDWIYSQCIRDIENSIEVAVLQDKGDLYVGFAGTEWNWEDWKHNLKWSFTPFILNGVEIKLYSGYYETYLKIKQRLQNILQILTGINRIIYTGHSQGGGYSIMALVDSLERGLPAYGITFGCPKVGDQIASERLESSVTRVQMRGDIVTMIPRNSWSIWNQEFYPIGELLLRGSVAGDLLSHKASRYQEEMRKLEIEYGR